MGQDSEISGAREPIYRHPPTVRTYHAIELDRESQGALAAHGERHLGGNAFVWREVVSDKVRIDVHLYPPTPDRHFWVLTTRGMSARPMNVPPELDDSRYAELVMGLPPDWPIAEAAFEREENFWPLRWLKTLARLPHDYTTWLGVGHTIPTAESPRPYAANTSLCCAFLVSPSRLPENFSRIQVSNDKAVHLLGFVPIYRQEMEFKLKNGADALAARLRDCGISEILAPGRSCIC